jgi:hypothetical protein
MGTEGVNEKASEKLVRGHLSEIFCSSVPEYFMVRVGGSVARRTGETQEIEQRRTAQGERSSHRPSKEMLHQEREEPGTVRAWKEIRNGCCG